MNVRESINPVAIDFVNVHLAAGKIIVGRKGESAGGAVKSKRGGLVRVVGIVGGETYFTVGFDGVEKQEGVIDAQRGKTDEMHDGRAVVFEVGDQSVGHALFKAVAEGHDEAPVAALEIALPRAAASEFKQRGLRGAEAMQIRIAGDDDFFRFGREFGGVRGGDAANQFAIGGGIGDGEVGVETGVFEELLGGAGHDKAVMVIFRRGVARVTDPFAVFVIVIFPNQFVGIGEGIGLKIERAPVVGGGRGRCRAAGSKDGAQPREAKEGACCTRGIRRMNHKFRPRS